MCNVFMELAVLETSHVLNGLQTVDIACNERTTIKTFNRINTQIGAFAPCPPSSLR
jgi:hypothetical protein